MSSPLAWIVVGALFFLELAWFHRKNKNETKKGQDAVEAPPSRPSEAIAKTLSKAA
jgi:hypothetical protein